jgi:chromosome segregation ATPase
MATSGNQTLEPKDTAVSVDPTQDKQDTNLSEIELKLLRHAEEGKQLSEMLAAAKNQSKNAQDLQQQIDQLTKEKDRLAKGYRQIEEKYNQLKEGNNQLVEEISQLKEQLATVNEQPNTLETQKLIDHLTIENDQLKEAREVAIEQLKAQPLMQDMINKLVEEKKELEEKHRNSTAEMKTQIQQLEKQAENLANELKMLRKENTGLQKELDKAGQDGPTKDMAKLLKRYYEMEEQFGQMKKDIKQDMKNVLAKKEKKIVQQVQGHLVENEKKMQETLMDNEKRMQENLAESEKKMQEHVEKRLGETEDYVQKQVERRLTENEKQIQERLGVNEIKVWGHGQEIQQKAKEIITKHDQTIQKIQKILPEVSGDIINEQGYFTRMIVRTPHRCLYLR